MTRDEILSMEPGRELDALVMRIVFNAEKKDIGDECYWVSEVNGEEVCWPRWFSPSTDIAAAWEVLEKFFWVQVTANPPHIWKATVITSPANGSVTATAKGYTAPEAICKAALLALEWGEESV